MDNIWSRGHEGEREELWIWLLSAVLQVLIHNYLCLLALLHTRFQFWKQNYLEHTVLRLYISFSTANFLYCTSKFL